MKLRQILQAFVLVAGVLASGFANAAFHLWKISEVFSNADGTIQFIELSTPIGSQQFVAGQSITSQQGATSNSFTFPANLPSDSANKSFLIATQGFAALGVVTPDYVVPNGFLFSSNGTLNFANGADVFTYASIPTNGRLSVHRDGGTTQILLNSPKNFAGVSGVVNAGPTSADFNGDAKADLVWRNQTTGENYAWFLNGTALQGSSQIASVPNNWLLMGTPDFNADGKPDLIWRDQTNGDVYAWFMAGTLFTGSAFISNVPTQWSIVGTPDLNGDGRPDLVWRNQTTGDVYVWYMNGVAVGSTAFMFNVADPWQIVATPDLNADGKADIIWRNQVTGDVYAWFMNGNVVTGSVFMFNVPAPWEIRGAPDFNGDGKPDLLWRNNTSGEVYAWFLNGLGVVGSTFMFNVPGVWTPRM